MQISKVQFRKLVMVYGVLMVGGFVAALFPSEINTAIDEAPLTGPLVLLGLLGIVLVIWSIFNLMALYRFESYAPKHLLIINLLGFTTYLFLPADVIATVPATSAQSFFNAVTFMFYDISVFLSGVILGIAYFSNLAPEFASPKKTVISQ